MAYLVQFAILCETDEEELVEAFALRARSELWQINRATLDERQLSAEDASEVVTIYGPSISRPLDLDIPELQTPDAP